MQPLLRPIFVAFAHFSYHHRDYVTAPLAMFHWQMAKSETVGASMVGGGEGGGKVSALIWSAHAVGSCFHTSCFRTPTRVIFTEMAA